MSGEILLIDDDPYIGSFLEVFLRRKGLSLTLAKSGAEAMELLTERDFGLILLDLDLVESPALEILGRIHENRPAPSVIVLSADSPSAPDCEEALRLGAASVLKKPFDLEASSEWINGLLNQPAAPPFAAHQTPANNATPMQAEILVIDDDPYLGPLLQKAGLKESWNVTLARSGEDGLSCVAGRTIDLVLLDLGLPEVPGLEVLARIRERGKHPPVVVITGRSDADPECDEALRIGAAGVLPKPFALPQFYATVRQFLTGFAVT